MIRNVHPIIAFTVIFSSYSYGSSELKGELVEQKGALPHALYDDAWPEAAYCISLDEAALQQTIVEVRQQKKEVADTEGWPEETRRICDWICAVDVAERLLFPKPFAEWTVTFINIVARYLTRFTAAEPGGYRNVEGAPQDFQKLLEASLRQCKELLANIPADCTDVQRELKILNAAASMQFDLARYAPFEKYNEDIGRLLMNSMLAQQGLPILRYPVLVDYQKALAESVSSSNPTALWNLTCDTYNNTKELLRLAKQQGKDFYHEQAALMLRQRQEAESLGDMLYLLAMEKNMEKIAGGGQVNQGGPEIVVADLKNESDIESLRELFTARLKNLTFDCVKCKKGGNKLICSRCRAVAYCSPECQKADWADHKLHCVKKESSEKK